MTTSRRSSNADTVATLYSAFLLGDIAGLLDHLNEDVAWNADWIANSAQQAGAVYLRARRGRAEIAELLASLSQCIIQDFDVLDIIGSGRQVAAEVRVDVTLPDGGRIIDQELHLWTFETDGRVIKFRSHCDTATHTAAHHRALSSESGERLMADAFTAGPVLNSVVAPQLSTRREWTTSPCSAARWPHSEDEATGPAPQRGMGKAPNAPERSTL